ncbi:hypothetical protein C8R46DRAFT_1231299 [Mycena filopes]|nr:hypothetical protein C8R46DRAFT_1231299 [Mycena filopes]
MHSLILVLFVSSNVRATLHRRLNSQLANSMKEPVYQARRAHAGRKEPVRQQCDRARTVDRTRTPLRRSPRFLKPALLVDPPAPESEENGDRTSSEVVLASKREGSTHSGPPLRPVPPFADPQLQGNNDHPGSVKTMLVDPAVGDETSVEKEYHAHLDGNDMVRLSVFHQWQAPFTIEHRWRPIVSELTHSLIAELALCTPSLCRRLCLLHCRLLAVFPRIVEGHKSSPCTEHSASRVAASSTTAPSSSPVSAFNTSTLSCPPPPSSPPPSVFPPFGPTPRSCSIRDALGVRPRLPMVTALHSVIWVRYSPRILAHIPQVFGDHSERLSAVYKGSRESSVVAIISPHPNRY